ncbi:MAG TPA: hypothetical protein EYQ74_07980 [Planctomycetes bacterium]|nr:hypothetical protein [Planctomycetota bacterium]HIK60437.1 hypothetical protein [Planctomycetota bacterium]
MKNLSFSLLVTVLVLSGGAAAVTSLLLHTSAPTPAEAPVLPDVNLNARLKALREENALLSQRIDALEMRPVATQRIPAGAVSDPGFEQEVREWMASFKNGGGPAPVGIQTKVEDVLANIRQEEAAAKQQVQEQKREEWITGTMAKLSPQLGLSVTQEDELRDVWIANNDRDNELDRMWGAGEIDSQAAGELKRSNHEEHQADLQGVLSPAQYEEYHGFFANRGGGRGK